MLLCACKCLRAWLYVVYTNIFIYIQSDSWKPNSLSLCLSAYHLQFFRMDFKRKPWTWTHKEPSWYIYLLFCALTEAYFGRFHRPPRRLIQGSAKLQSEGGLEMSQSRSELNSKAISLPNNIFANLWRRWSCWFARLWWPDCFEWFFSLFLMICFFLFF